MRDCMWLFETRLAVSSCSQLLIQYSLSLFCNAFLKLNSTNQFKYIMLL